MTKKRQELQDAPMDGFNIRLTAWHPRICRKAGEGNMAEGVRKAIEMMAEEKKKYGKQSS